MFQLRKGYEVDVQVLFTDDLGNPAMVDGVPSWSVDDLEAFLVSPSVDGMTAILQGVGSIIGTTSVITVTADADLGEGIVGVTRSEDIQLISGQATSVAFGFGEPRPMGG
jgi:hypothetical protein